MNNLKTKLWAPDVGTTSNAIASPRLVTDRCVMNAEIELLSTCVTSTENAAVSIDQQPDNYRARLSTYKMRASYIFAEMYESDSLMERLRL